MSPPEPRPHRERSWIQASFSYRLRPYSETPSLEASELSGPSFAFDNSGDALALQLHLDGLPAPTSIGAESDHCFEVHDDKGRSLMLYYLQTVENADADGDELELLVVTWPRPSRGSLGAWERWRRGRPLVCGSWKELNHAGRRSWLDVALHRALDPPSVAPTLELDCRDLVDRSSTFCALGEALGGPGGYRGKDLDGLDDCVGGSFGTPRPTHLLFTNCDALHDEHAPAFHGRRGLPTRSRADYIDRLIDVLHKAGVECVLR